MVLTRLQDNTPEIYSSASRDFQLLERLYDAVLNGAKYDTYSMLGVIDSMHCRASLLPFLRTAVGFISTAKYPDKVLRILVTAFPYLIRTKGTLNCVVQATRVYLKAYGISGDVVADDDKDKGAVNLTVYSAPVDVMSLSSFVKFFAPTGLKFNYTFSTPSRVATQTIETEDGVAATIGNIYSAGIRLDSPWDLKTPDTKTAYKSYVDKYISAVGSAVVAGGTDKTYTERELQG